MGNSSHLKRSIAISHKDLADASCSSGWTANRNVFLVPKRLPASCVSLKVDGILGKPTAFGVCVSGPIAVRKFGFFCEGFLNTPKLGKSWGKRQQGADSVFTEPDGNFTASAVLRPSSDPSPQQRGGGCDTKASVEFVESYDKTENKVAVFGKRETCPAAKCLQAKSTGAIEDCKATNSFELAAEEDTEANCSLLQTPLLSTVESIVINNQNETFHSSPSDYVERNLDATLSVAGSDLPYMPKFKTDGSVQAIVEPSQNRSCKKTFDVESNSSTFKLTNESGGDSDELSKGLPEQLKDIIIFAGPALGIWLSGPLMSLIDTAVVGNGSSLELAALAQRPQR